MAAIQPLLLIVAFVAFFYFLAIRPQRRRQQELNRLRENLKPGDEIVTLSGIYGTVTEVEDGGTVLIEVSEDTEIRIAAASIGQIVTGHAVPGATEPSASE